jgi:hypothetical protein
MKNGSRLVGALRASLIGISAYATAYLFFALVWHADTALFVGLCLGEFIAHYFCPNAGGVPRPESAVKLSVTLANNPHQPLGK